jgi:hypothetical protein
MDTNITRKPRFVHYHVPCGPWPRRKPRGFTALLTPLGNGKVEVGLTFCSPRDTWTRKEGREWAEKATPMIIEVNKLPELLATCVNVVRYGKLKATVEFEWQSWDYILKYVD